MGYEMVRRRVEPSAAEREEVQALRRCAERIGTRAELLAERERSLLEAVFVDGRSRNQMARLLRCDPRTVRRKLRQIVHRMECPKFMFVASHLDLMGTARRRVAQACVLHGLSLRRAAAALQMPINSVRHHAAAVHAMFEAAGKLRVNGGGRVHGDE